MADVPTSVPQLGNTDYLEAVYSTSPRRSISWVAQDSLGNQTQATNSTGQPLQYTLYPQVVVRESGIDRLQLTQHPVERGSTITDHAYKLPAAVEIRAGWSYAALPIIGATPVATDPSYLQRLYATLLQIQLQRSFVTLVTGKRTYTYMLLESLEVHTDEESENILDLAATFQEILMAQTQVVSTFDPNTMKSPAINQPTVNQGNTSLQSGANANVPALRGAAGLDFSGATP
jgi:Dit-like phage tail protein